VELSSRSLADVLVVAPVGQIDHPNAQRLQEALASMRDVTESTKSALLFDFSGVEYISSMGLRVLMVTAKQMRSQKKRIAVAALQPVVEEIFEIARFKHVLEVFPSVRTALQQLSQAALSAYDAAAR
jgi:anti-anti-sigma factor